MFNTTYASRAQRITLAISALVYTTCGLTFASTLTFSDQINTYILFPVLIGTLAGGSLAAIVLYLTDKTIPSTPLAESISS